MNLDLFADDTEQVAKLVRYGRFADTPYAARLDTDHQGVWIDVPNGALYYAPYFFVPSVSDALLRQFLHFDGFEGTDILAFDWRSVANVADLAFQNIDWQQDRITLYGKTHNLPRLTAWYGDRDCVYRYSGLTLTPQPWTAELDFIREQLATVCTCRFNSVLLNWYRDGRDHMSWHADDEVELGYHPTIASVSFGATRRFVLRRCEDHTQKLILPLYHGSVLMMAGALQQHWQHSVPKQAAVRTSRINLTFRTIHSPFG